MTKILKCLLFFALIVLSPINTFAKRAFIHPGISYTQADLDRMKAMVAAKQEPFYSSYLKMKADVFSSRGGRTGLTRINEGQFNGIIGVDGRAALQQALIWKIEGDLKYADRAVQILNGYKNLVSASSRGTGPLDNGKIYMLIDAAELMRDYSGWSSTDQKAFKDMLVHPGYSTKVIPSSHYNLDDALNDVTFYWNIFNGDSGRHGNQGIFALRGLMAMGIFMDNDTIYDRAYRKFMSQPHRRDDLAYPSGPPVINYTSGTYSTFEEYSLGNRLNTVTDYGYDDELKYYIYENGQCQESFRDQAHTMCGITNCFDMAKMAWNQGDNMFDAYSGRLLKGLEWNT
ncbi:MAG: alginate lyase family protein, partial [Bacteroidota bacterium]|nr:alginate lyase family protein [Bacteroidota bacterium]